MQTLWVRIILDSRKTPLVRKERENGFSMWVEDYIATSVSDYVGQDFILSQFETRAVGKLDGSVNGGWRNASQIWEVTDFCPSRTNAVVHSQSVVGAEWEPYPSKM